MAPRKASGEVRDQQLLLRLAASHQEVLVAIAHLEGVTPNAYAYRLLAAHLDRLGTQPHVVADLANRRAYSGAQAEVSSLPRPTASKESPASKEPKSRKAAPPA